MKKSDGHVSDTKHDPCPASGLMEETEMIPVGWNSQKGGRQHQQKTNMILAPDKKEMIPGGWKSQTQNCPQCSFLEALYYQF